MGYDIIRGNDDKSFAGCDFVVRLTNDRKNTKVKILQLTDIQVIDASQCRTPDRLRIDEINAWNPKLFDSQCGNHIRSLITQTRPDLIIITGDIVYGSFDDQGSTLEWFCSLMDSFGIPWAPTFGNHDNESRKGVAWQCSQFKKSKYCLFKRGEVSGNSNYSVGIAIGEDLIRVIHMIDSNGCSAGVDPSIIKENGIYADQLKLIEDNTSLINRAQNKKVPAFMAFHIPISCFRTAEIAKQYQTDERDFYSIGVDVTALDGDFGFKLEKYKPIEVDDGFISFLHSQYIEGVFVGHVHNNCTCIDYENVKWVFGLKTGQYDYHIPGQLGGTLITLENEGFSVAHIPALVHYAPMPGKAKMFNDFFADDAELAE
ncbi:MAG: metallophosphoesterase [Clostridia bacterium]|nr:metallophosphoesterase [Clostridia bacterium]